MSSPRLLRKLNNKRAFRILVLGQGGVGKTALTVRFVTRRFIGEYDPNLEKKYHHTSEVDEEPASFEILDTAGQEDTSGRIEENIRWADAFLLVYDICDVCSFTEVTRLKFLINHTKKPRRQHIAAGRADPLVFLLANKKDLDFDRMVLTEEGQSKAEQLNCTKFYEISVRESCDDVVEIFHELYRLGRDLRRPWLSRSSSSQKTLSVEDSGQDSPEEPDRSPRPRKASVSQRIIRAVMPSTRSRSDELVLETAS